MSCYVTIQVFSLVVSTCEQKLRYIHITENQHQRKTTGKVSQIFRKISSLLSPSFRFFIHIYLPFVWKAWVWLLLNLVVLKHTWISSILRHDFCCEVNVFGYFLWIFCQISCITFCNVMHFGGSEVLQKDDIFPSVIWQVTAAIWLICTRIQKESFLCQNCWRTSEGSKCNPSFNT